MEKQKTKTNDFFKKIFSPIKHIFDRKNEPLLHTIEWIFILIAFFGIGFSMIYYQKTIELYEKLSDKYLGSKDAIIQTAEEEKLFTGETIAEPIDTTDWDTYRNQWYGFEVRHPDTWKNNTQYKTATEKSARYETIYKFRKDDDGEENPFSGYDVVVYSAKKVPNIENTNEIRKKDDIPEGTDDCSFSEEVNMGEENNQYQKVSIKDDNLCYEPIYFYSISKGNYVYNIVPAVKEDTEKFSNPEEKANKDFPEFKEAVSSFKFIPIVRPQVKAKPKITARKPVSAKVVNGKLVCAKKNDKPGKSKNGNKKGHLDLECCLDPDETTNPWCTY